MSYVVTLACILFPQCQWHSTGGYWWNLSASNCNKTWQNINGVQDFCKANWVDWCYLSLHLSMNLPMKQLQFSKIIVWCVEKNLTQKVKSDKRCCLKIINLLTTCSFTPWYQSFGCALVFMPKGVLQLSCNLIDHAFRGHLGDYFYLNTLRLRQNGRHFADDTFKCFFLNKNVWILINCSLKFVPEGPINPLPALVQIMAWRRRGDKPLS